MIKWVKVIIEEVKKEQEVEVPTIQQLEDIMIIILEKEITKIIETTIEIIDKIGIIEIIDKIGITEIIGTIGAKKDLKEVDMMTRMIDHIDKFKSY